VITVSRRHHLVLERPPVGRPTNDVPPTFVCPACDVVLWDGAVYSTCPVCGLPVDWVDLTVPVWCCPSCDVMINEERQEPPRCEACEEPLVRIHALEAPAVGGVSTHGELLAKVFLVLVGSCLLGLLLSLALDPRLRLLALAARRRSS
jgi:hypothetical protein